MYTADESYGLPPYSSSFMALDLEGFDAPGGAKGRWMLTGLYSPGASLPHWRDTSTIPYERV